jgi:exodeoxyribonuclease VII large subunit
MAELAHPDRPLSRGFARVTTALADAHCSRPGSGGARIGAALRDGVVDAVVGVPAPAKVERPAARAYLSPQPGLFDAPEE